MNILAIGPHPDDIEFGCGGTLVKYARKGHRVYLLVITRGEKGGDARVRHEEQLKAAEILGAQDVFWGSFQDTQLLDKDNEIIHLVEDCLERVKADFTFVNHFEDTHQDHRIVNRSVVSATRYIKNVMFYEGPTTKGFSPNVFVDIESAMEKKLAALSAHASQVNKTNIPALSILEVARSAAHFRGVQGRVALAEGFVSERLFINIDEEP